MTAKKKPSSRHAQPTTDVLLNRIYRRTVDMDRNLKRTMKTLADDFTRVLRQNDTLRGENETLKEMLQCRDSVTQANAFLASPLPPRLPIHRVEALRDRIEALNPSGASEAAL